MKEVMLLMMLCLFAVVPSLAQRKQLSDSVKVIIRLTNASRTPYTDSVLVIFDRYDHSGAGVIKQVYYPVDNQIVIFKVPAARYYIEISCLGTHREKFIELTYINNRHSNIFSYRVNNTSTFTPGLATIPVTPIDFSKLTILKEQ